MGNQLTNQKEFKSSKKNKEILNEENRFAMSFGKNDN